jgi:hypothetical protein
LRRSNAAAPRSNSLRPSAVWSRSSNSAAEIAAWVASSTLEPRGRSGCLALNSCTALAVIGPKTPSTASAVATSESWLRRLWSAETSLPRWPWRSVFVVVTAWRASSAPTMRLPAVR